MTTNSDVEIAPKSTPKMRGPLWWTIRGDQNNWNWKVDPDYKEIGSDEIDYQTRFPEEDLGEVYQGADASAPLLATIKIGHFSAEITFPHSPSTDCNRSPRNPITMYSSAKVAYSCCWVIHVHSLENRTLNWEYEHPAYGDNYAYLRDPATGEYFGHANDNILGFYGQMPEAVVEELVIFGTAAEMMLVGALSHNDMSIAMMGPEGRENWKYQDPNWCDEEESVEDEEEEEEMERVETAMLATGKVVGEAGRYGLFGRVYSVVGWIFRKRFMGL